MISSFVTDIAAVMVLWSNLKSDWASLRIFLSAKNSFKWEFTRGVPSWQVKKAYIHVIVTVEIWGVGTLRYGENMGCFPDFGDRISLEGQIENTSNKRSAIKSEGSKVRVQTTFFWDEYPLKLYRSPQQKQIPRWVRTGAGQFGLELLLHMY